ncbi:Zinc finger, RING-type [Sesbania bispinosa]|nr:Zinc finger, RING-type [Sesbania bispinosa]
MVSVIFFSLYLYTKCVQIRRQSHRRAAIRRRLDLALQLYQQHMEEPPTIGLDPPIIAALPAFIVESKVREDGGGGVMDCAVCLSALEDEEMAKLLPNCKHYFHVACIDTWLALHCTCPLCRTAVQPRLEPHLREGPTALALDVAPLESVVLEETNSDGDHGGVGESPRIDGDGSNSRLGSFRRVLSRDRSSRRIAQVQPSDVHQDLERQTVNL